MASLIVMVGQPEQAHYTLSNRPLSAGRHPARDIQLLDPKVGKRHFGILKQDEHYLVRDYNSKNGVFVNGARVDGEKTLHDGDEIVAGDTVLAFFESDQPDRTNWLNRRKVADRGVREDRTITE